MEWNAMHAPLEPPPGYEYYHSTEAVFPGLRAGYKVKTWKDLKFVVNGTWKLYKHHYIPDPEVEAWLGRITKRDQAKKEERSERVTTAVASDLHDAVQSARKVASAAKDLQPNAEQFMKERVSLLQESIGEFTAGFKETVTGETNVWGFAPYDIDIIESDNAPVVYSVVSTKNGKREDGSALRK